MRAKRRAYGKCLCCGKNPAPGMKTCEKTNQRAKNRNRQIKEQVLDHYGRECACCGESGLTFLCVDHINNDGAEHRKKAGIGGGSETYAWLVKESFPDGFQILCYNCNIGKHHSGGVCPHQLE